VANDDDDENGRGGISQNELSARIVDGTVDFVAVIDRRMRYVLWNRGAEQLTGIASADVLGRTMREVVPEHTRSRALDRARRALDGETIHLTTPERVPRSDGTARWVTGVWSPLRDEAGTIVGAISVRHDVTEREQVRLDAERNARLVALGRLVGGVAHEIRNPLFGISASLDALELGLGGDPAHRPLTSAIRREVDTLRSLVDELLAYGRPGTPTLVTAPLLAMLDEARRATSMTAASRAVTVTITSEVEPAPTVRCDVQRLPRLFANVIDNALRFSPAGEAVTIRVTPGEDGEVVVSVADRGPGFPPDGLAEVFEPFFTKRPGGTGLGLAVAAQIAREHDARIEAHAPEGGGGLVVVHMPPPRLRGAR
jgi:PAS domain S-box-containing protein